MPRKAYDSDLGGHKRHTGTSNIPTSNRLRRLTLTLTHSFKLLQYMQPTQPRVPPARALHCSPFGAVELERTSDDSLKLMIKRWS